jgi:ribosomal protein L30/L7E
MATSPRHSSRQHRAPRAIVPPGFVEEPSMELLRALPDGQRIEVLLVRSTNGTTARQQGTLRSVGLKRHTGARVEIRNHARSTPGMLHQVRHLVAVRVADGQESRGTARKRRQQSSHQREGLKMATYKTSGGTSALVSTAGGWSVRIEAHEDSFAMVWPAASGLATLVDWLDSRGARGEAMVGRAGQAPQELDWSGLSDLAAGNAEAPDFVRVDLEELVLTWTDTPRQLPVGKGSAAVHEAGVGASSFDAKLLIALISETAVGEVAAQAQQLVAQARKLLTRLPEGELQLTA